MSTNWNSDQPIYKQLRDRVAALIMDGQIAEGEYVPSVRQVSANENINHLTVAKAYQELVDEGVLQMQRGRGMLVLEGAQEKLVQAEREKFEQIEVPELKKRLANLRITDEELYQALRQLDDSDK